jgi:O-acetyl-ADP-ribose deacetylase (regulator of RNase III)
MKLARRVQLIQGNIVLQDVDAIVNAANSELQRGAGVCGAIFAAAGPRLEAACDAIGGCPPGEARITPGFMLEARHIIHAVGPIYQGGKSGEAELLAGAYRSSLELCATHQCRSIAFPAISTGIYGYPKEEAARTAIGTVCEWLSHHTVPERVVFVLFTRQDLDVYQSALDELAA